MKELTEVKKDDYCDGIFDGWTTAYCDVCEADIVHGQRCYNEIESNNYICKECYESSSGSINAYIRL